MNANEYGQRPVTGFSYKMDGASVSPLTPSELATVHSMIDARETIRQAVVNIPFVQQVMQACFHAGVPEADFHTVLAANLINQFRTVHDAQMEITREVMKPYIIVTTREEAEAIVTLLKPRG